MTFFGKKSQNLLETRTTGEYIIPRCDEKDHSRQQVSGVTSSRALIETFFVFWDHLREAGNRWCCPVRCFLHRPQMVFFSGEKAQ